MTAEEDDDEDIVDAVQGFATDPLRALFRGIASIEKERCRGDDDMEHISKDLLADVLIREGVFLDVAEAIVRKLVEQDPDAKHLGMLVGVLEKTGRTAETIELRVRAAAAKDTHYDPQIEALVKGRLAKYGPKK